MSPLVALCDTSTGPDDVCFRGIVLQKSIFADDQNSAGRGRDFAGLPATPTAAECGFPGFEVGAWFGLVAPAGTPDAVIARINAGIREVLADPAVRERFAALGATPKPGGAIWRPYRGRDTSCFHPKSLAVLLDRHEERPKRSMRRELAEHCRVLGLLKRSCKRSRKTDLERGRLAYFRYERGLQKEPAYVWHTIEHNGLPFFLGDTRTEREGRTALNWHEARIMSPEQFATLCKWLEADEYRDVPKFGLSVWASNDCRAT